MKFADKMLAGEPEEVELELASLVVVLLLVPAPVWLRRVWAELTPTAQNTVKVSSISSVSSRFRRPISGRPGLRVDWRETTGFDVGSMSARSMFEPTGEVC